MKATVEFEKTGMVGEIVVSIVIVESHSCLTRNLFKDRGDYPTNERFQLGLGITDCIKNFVVGHDEAEEWASAQIEALRAHIKKWRETELPENYEVDI